MNEINMNISSHSHYFLLNLIDHQLQSNDNRTLPLLQFNNSWIFPLFILSLLGILLTIIILFLFLYISIRRLNNQLILTNLFICFSVCFIYIIVIFFLIRGNELICGLREFLSQFAYALLYSALLCRYIMQWLTARILSKRTKQLLSLIIYLLLIFIQIPIGILWWHFTIPRVCQQRTVNEYPTLKLHFQRRISTSPIKPCSYQCIVDYRFYATYTYTILELFVCTIIATCLYLYHCCRQHKNEKEKLIKTTTNNSLLAFFNMSAFILIDVTWIVWSLVYHFTHPFFVYPSIVISMFTIGTICLVFILFPQIYFYSKIRTNDIEVPNTTLFTNKLASIEDMKDQDLLLQETYTDQNKQQTLLSGSELSYELGTSGTFLPITRTPKGPFKVTNKNKTAPIEKFDKLIYDEHSSTAQILANQDKSIKNERKINKLTDDVTNQQEQQMQSSIAPLQRQLTSSSIASDFLNPVMRTEHRIHRSKSNIHPSSSSSMYYSSYVRPYRDETIIPILCNSQRHQTATPVKMRILVKSPSSSVPTTRRIHSGRDHRYIRHPYHPILPPPPPTQQQQYHFVDPYRTMPSYSSGNLWQPVLSSSHRYPYSYHQFQMDNRSLSQRLWDIDSGDDEDEILENIRHIRGRGTPTIERLKDFRSNHFESNDNTILHIDDDDDDDEEDTYNKKLIFV